MTPEALRTLRAHLAIAERALTGAAPADVPEPPTLAHVTPGDLAQIKPAADPVFGGLLFRVTKTASNLIRGYILVPWRGGMLESWQTWRLSDIEKVGRVAMPEAEWGFSERARGQRRRMWVE